MNKIQPDGMQGRIERYEPFESKYVIPRIVDVWLPDEYDTNLDQRYAVLYMHDGQNLFDPENSKISHEDWGIDEAITRLRAESRIRPTIVVGMWCTPKRVIEYMPYKVGEGERREKFMSKFSEKLGGEPESDNYLKFIVEEVKPFIDTHYRTLADRENTFVMGSSMGGLISLYALSEYPAVFKGAGCVSTHFPIGRGIVLNYMKTNFPKAGGHLVYFDYGTGTLDAHYAHYQDQADKIMIKKGYTRGVDWLTERFEGHDHSEVYWRQRVHIPLEFLLK